MAPPTPYPDLNSVLQELVSGIQSALTANFLGAYLQGSFAVGDFDLHSDVDFIIAIHHELAGEQVQALERLHAGLFSLECAWAQHLEGSYFPAIILRDYTKRGTPLWYLEHGYDHLGQSDHCNTIVVRWVLREHGVTLAGPDPAHLVDPIPTASLRQEILETIAGWGREILADPQIINNRFYQGFAVLSYCRMLHDLYKGRVSSKHAGADLAKANLDPSWRGLIDRSWDGRPNPAQSVRQPANPEEIKRTLDFIKYIIDLAQQYSWE